MKRDRTMASESTIESGGAILIAPSRVPKTGSDLGCGTGNVALVVQELRRARVVGIEPDAERANLAKSRGIEVIHGYLTSELARTLGRFDAVIFADVLEHLADPLPLLQLGCSFLASRGVVVISVPNVAPGRCVGPCYAGVSTTMNSESWMRRTFAGSPPIPCCAG